MRPKVSIIVPIYNAEKYIGRCIESIKKQTLSEWELIIIDDCSTDKSCEIVKDYASKDRRIKTKCQEENHGPMVARRVGDMLSSGEFITYCDGDDVLPTDALQTLYELAISSEADIVIGNYLYVSLHNTKEVKKNVLKYGNNGLGFFKALLKRDIKQTLWGKLYRSELIKAYDYHIVDNMTNAEDAFLLYQLIPNIEKVVSTHEVVYHYIQAPGSSSNRRYSYKALDNICNVNALRVSLIPKYPELRREIVAKVSDVIVSLIHEGYNKQEQLTELLSKYKIEKYASNHSIVSSHNMLRAVQMLMKKYAPHI